MGLDNNDSNIRDLKASLCDFLCQKIKELSDIEDAKKKDDYLACLIKVAKNADDLSNSFKQFEMLGLPINIGESSEKKEELVKKVGQILADKKAAVSDLEKSEASVKNSEVKEDNNFSTMTPPANNSINMIIPEKKPTVVPPSVDNENEKKKEIKSVLAPSIKIEAPALSNMPNIFEGIFNNNASSNTDNGSQVDSTDNKEEITVPAVVNKEESKTSEVAQEIPATSSQDSDLISHSSVVPIPKVDNVINNDSNSSVSPLVAAYTSDSVQDDSSNLVADTVQNNSLDLANESKIKVHKLSGDKVKAILVNKSQLEKLSKSLEKQSQLLGFEQAEMSQYDIEEMMNMAKQLYNDGKQQEAQQLYNQISQLNKANLLVKKAA